MNFIVCYSQEKFILVASRYQSDSVFTPSVIYLILMSTIDYIQTKPNKP